MKNAYKILGVPQNANTVEIVKGQVTAMKERNYSPAEIAMAKKILSTPALRLALDFTCPIIESTNIPQIITSTPYVEFDIVKIDRDAFDSLK